MADAPVDPKAAPAATGGGPPEDEKAKATRLAAGNPVEFDKALANATPTEKDALLAAKRERELANKPISFAAVGPGGAFAIDGSGFGATGTLNVNGVNVPTTRWSDTSIRGTLPHGVTEGPVTITTETRTFKGTYGKTAEEKAAAAKQSVQPPSGPPAAAKT
jgi:hypothetical protein